LGPTQFETYAKPYANRAMQYVRDRHPDVPVVYYANGGSSYLVEQKDMACDMISLDWACDLAQARQTLGPDRLVQGNIDPTVLMGSQEQIRAAVHECIRKGGGRGHLLNLGHGVLQGTPEESIQHFVDAAKELSLPLK
jgi:uroporphyrinogen decarboxylase